MGRRKDRLEALAEGLRAEHGTAAEVIGLDLADDGAVAELARRTTHLDEEEMEAVASACFDYVSTWKAR